MVSQHEPQLELDLRQADGTWVLVEARAGEMLALKPLGISLAVDEVYRAPLG